MFKKIMVLLYAVLIMVSYAVARDKDEESLKIGTPVPDDKEYSLDVLIGKEEEHKRVLILVMGDRKVREDANKWAKELHKLHGKNEDIAMLMVADLRDLPFFVTEKLVKWGTKRDKLPVTIVLDWKGKVNAQYKTSQKKTDIFIVDRNGKLAYHQIDQYSEEVMKKLQTELQKTIEKGQTTPESK